MDQNTINSDPLIILRLSPGCSIQSLSVMYGALQTKKGVSAVKYDLINMKLCLRSTIDPFLIVGEIGQVDAKVELIHYNKEPMLSDYEDAKDPIRNGQRNQADIPNGCFKEQKRGVGDEQFDDLRNGQRTQPMNDPNGGFKEQKRNVDEQFEDPRNFQRNQPMNGGPTGVKEQKRNVNENFEDLRNQPMNGRNSKEEECYDGRRNHWQPADEGYNYVNYKEKKEYVCRNYREDVKEEDPGMCGPSFRMPYRSQSCRFDERNSNQRPSHNAGKSRHVRFEN